MMTCNINNIKYQKLNIKIVVSLRDLYPRRGVSDS